MCIRVLLLVCGRVSLRVQALVHLTVREWCDSGGAGYLKAALRLRVYLPVFLLVRCPVSFRVLALVWLLVYKMELGQGRRVLVAAKHRVYLLVLLRVHCIVSFRV